MVYSVYFVLSVDMSSISSLLMQCTVVQFPVLTLVITLAHSTPISTRCNTGTSHIKYIRYLKIPSIYKTFMALSAITVILNQHYNISIRSRQSVRHVSITSSHKQEHTAGRIVQHFRRLSIWIIQKYISMSENQGLIPKHTIQYP